MLCYGLLFVMWCDVAPPPVAVSSYCAVARPVYWHASDTRKTKEQVDRENRKYKRLCGASKY